MDISKIRVTNFEGAFKGMRNPLQSHDKSDSWFGITSIDHDHDYDIAEKWIKDIRIGSIDYDREFERVDSWLIKNGILTFNDHYFEVAFVGPKDMKLAQNLIAAGSDHRKFMRQIMVSMDIEMPLYWWKEADTYKIGTTANSESTMHTLSKTPVTRANFELDTTENDGLLIYDNHHGGYFVGDFIDGTIEDLEQLRQLFLKTKDTRYWRALIQMLPSSWLQKRTWTANYEVLRNIYFARKNHKLKEWRFFCEQIEKLPYGKELITYEGI